MWWTWSCLERKEKGGRKWSGMVNARGDDVVQRLPRMRSNANLNGSHGHPLYERGNKTKERNGEGNGFFSMPIGENISVIYIEELCKGIL